MKLVQYREQKACAALHEQVHLMTVFSQFCWSQQVGESWSPPVTTRRVHADEALRVVRGWFVALDLEPRRDGRCANLFAAMPWWVATVLPGSRAASAQSASWSSLLSAKRTSSLRR